MINHFRTHLLNQPHHFFAESQFPIYTDPKFVPVPFDDATKRIDTILFGRSSFGEVSDGTLRNYRFIEFLHLISACNLYRHVRLFDTRETYKLSHFGAMNLDLFVPPRHIAEVIDEALSLGQSVYADLFFPLRKSFPEYEEGFRHVTDTINRFCLLLFAQAIRNERRE